jgi:hypothetical protein
MARYRHDLLGRATGLGQSSAGGLSKAVCTSPVGQSGGIAAFPEPCAEAIGRARLAERGGEKRQVARRRGLDCGPQCRVERDKQRRAGLLLPNRDQVATDVLTAHAHDIATTLAGVEQQRQGETR